MFEVAGQYPELLARLFPMAADGHLEFGSARSAVPVAGAASVAEWVEFSDYIMEGFVRYTLRAVPSAAGLRLDVRLSGTNRDQYVGPSMRSYIGWAGLSLVAVPAADQDTPNRSHGPPT
ncbi:MAG: hypothetical protein ACRCZF_09370 [Gemmataceae bacterium]